MYDGIMHQPDVTFVMMSILGISLLASPKIIKNSVTEFVLFRRLIIELGLAAIKMFISFTKS